jgi:hypothetical protein
VTISACFQWRKTNSVVMLPPALIGACAPRVPTADQIAPIPANATQQAKRNPLGKLAIYRRGLTSREAYETPALPLSYTADPGNSSTDAERNSTAN